MSYGTIPHAGPDAAAIYAGEEWQRSVERMARFLCLRKRSDPDEPVYYGPVSDNTSRPLWTHYADEASVLLQEAKDILNPSER